MFLSHKTYFLHSGRHNYSPFDPIHSSWSRDGYLLRNMNHATSALRSLLYVSNLSISQNARRSKTVAIRITLNHKTSQFSSVTLICSESIRNVAHNRVSPLLSWASRILISHLHDSGRSACNGSVGGEGIECESGGARREQRIEEAVDIQRGRIQECLPDQRWLLHAWKDACGDLDNRRRCRILAKRY